MNRQELCTQSHISPQASDEEILVTLYRRQPDRAATLIAGTFAFVLWDGRRQRLLAVRDRAGRNTIHYSIQSDAIYLSTQAEVISNQISHGRRLNLKKLAFYVNETVAPDAWTYYEHIRQIEAGGMLECTRTGVAYSRYWSLTPGKQIRLKNDEEYADAYRERMKEAVSGLSRFGKAAITLTSGLDSNSVAASLRNACPDLQLFGFTTATPGVPAANEWEPSRRVADHLGIPLTDVLADNSWPLSNPDEMTCNGDEPPLSYYMEWWGRILAAVRSNELTHLVQGGAGGIFESVRLAYADLLLTGKWVQLVEQIRQHRRRSAISYQKLLRAGFISPILRAYAPVFLKRRLVRLNPRYSGMVQWLTPESRKLVMESLRSMAIGPMSVLPGRAQLLQTIHTWPYRQALAHLSRQASRFGIQIHCPLSDHRLQEFVASLPPRQLVRAGVHKIIVRNAYRGALPDEAIDRTVKITPREIAVRGLRAESRKILAVMKGMRLSDLGIIDETTLRDYYVKFLDGAHNDTVFFYAIAAELWLRRYHS
jgi:asparagine synthase (glutamine-hydrolysing)